MSNADCEVRLFLQLTLQGALLSGMSAAAVHAITIPVAEGQTVSGLLQGPPEPRACYVLAHSAGAGMTHPFLTAMAEGLAGRGIATLRYQFLYMEKGGRRPDPPKLAHAAVRAAVLEASRQLPGVPLFAGGKSFGGRMTSQAQAVSPLPGVRGLVFLGFPLHPPGKPSNDRAKHLEGVNIPMLFLQGTRDEFAELPLLEPLCRDLGVRTTLKLFPEADHSFHVPVRSGQKDADVRQQIMDTMAEWMIARTR
ncbi:MAG TPA: alpha/beta family hydrolase [Opitutus sp.]|nr:alpha/beta family hydrolase [Opitutus sp.]